MVFWVKICLTSFSVLINPTKRSKNKIRKKEKAWLPKAAAKKILALLGAMGEMVL